MFKNCMLEHFVLSIPSKSSAMWLQIIISDLDCESENQNLLRCSVTLE